MIGRSIKRLFRVNAQIVGVDCIKQISPTPVIFTATANAVSTAPISNVDTILSLLRPIF